MKRLSTLLALSLVITVFAFVFAAAQLSLPDTLLASLDRTSTGSGAIVSSNGYILTNNHVIDGATTIEVVLTTGRTYEAQVIETDPDQDLALIKINVSGLPAIPIDTQRVVRVGEPVVSIGSPKDYVGTVSSGTITAMNRTLTSLGLSGLYQTNADIAPGSSGGPLIDEYGNIIGINVAVAIEGEDHVPITAFGFSIPISQAQHMLRHISNAPSSRQGALSVPDIAEMCAPATVYIVCTREVPLASLLPDKLSGFTRGGFADSGGVRQEYAAEMADQLNIFFALASDWNWDCVCSTPRKFFGELGKPSTRLGGTDLAWACVGGYPGSSVLLAVCSEPAGALRIADIVREHDLAGLDVIAEGTYPVGDRLATVEIGVSVKWGYMRGTMTLPIGDLLLCATVTARNSSIASNNTSSGLNEQLYTAYARHYYYEDECLKLSLTSPNEGDPTTWKVSPPQTVICLEGLTTMLERIFEDAVGSLAAGL